MAKKTYVSAKKSGDRRGKAPLYRPLERRDLAERVEVAVRSALLDSTVNGVGTSLAPVVEKISVGLRRLLIADLSAAGITSPTDAKEQLKLIFAFNGAGLESTQGRGSNVESYLKMNIEGSDEDAKAALAHVMLFCHEQVLLMLYCDHLSGMIKNLQLISQHKNPPEGWDIYSLEISYNGKHSFGAVLGKNNAGLHDPEGWFKRFVLPTLPEKWREAYEFKNADDLDASAGAAAKTTKKRRGVGSKHKAAEKDTRANAPRKGQREMLRLYMRQVVRHPLVTREGERALGLLVMEGNEEARKRLVEANLRLVVTIIMPYISKTGSLTIMDLIQEGNLGLMRAVEKFNPHKGKLSTYAGWWIEAFVRNAIRDSASIVKRGTSQKQRKVYSNLRAAIEDLEREFRAEGIPGRPSIEDIAEKLDVRPKDVLAITTIGDSSMSTPLGDEEGSAVLQDMFQSDLPTPDERLEWKNLAENAKVSLETAMSGLSQREREIIQLRRLAKDPLNLRQIGDRLGISRERVRQLEVRAMRKIRNALIRMGISPKELF